MKKILLTLAAVLAGLSLIASTEAKRPAHAGPPASTGTLSLDQSAPSLGDTVTYTFTFEGTKNNDVMVATVCSQGGTPVFSTIWPAENGAATLLGGVASNWLENGGPADCVAYLFYWDRHPVQTEVRLAEIAYAAGG